MSRWSLFALALTLAAAPLPAQLASPGKLSRAHESLEGIRSCTRCHELRQQGIAPSRCLSCHAPIARRVQAGTGVHGALRDRDCARCHQEHIGADADILRFDTTSFDHARAGWPLEGEHAGARCRDCHRAEFITAPDVRAYRADPAFLAGTFLGVSRECVTCHRAESPHEAAINRRSCAECHTARDWKHTRNFDHGDTAYPLTGAHESVSCAGCHQRGQVLRLTGIAHGSCRDCHRDPHAARFGAGCSDCHQTTAWRSVAAARVASRFDHARTSFPLRGAHGGLECARCHDRAQAQRPGLRLRFTAATATFPRPVVVNCGSCHTDFHAGQIENAAACDRCHAENAWLPVSFGVARHQAETSFELEGAHLTVRCGQCHVRPAANGPPQLQWRDRDCRACHAAQDPHGEMFAGRLCGECHRGGLFKGAHFDHTTTTLACASCHATDSPHAAQFENRSCGECHGVENFRIAAFPHDRTRFPLTGAHEQLPCSRCHEQRNGVVHYRPLPITCAGCHGGKS